MSLDDRVLLSSFVFLLVCIFYDLTPRMEHLQLELTYFRRARKGATFLTRGRENAFLNESVRLQIRGEGNWVVNSFWETFYILLL